MHTLHFYFLLYKKPRFPRDDFYAAQESDTENPFPMRVDTLRSSWWNRLVRGRLDVKLDSYRRNANCEAASFSVSFCATSRISFGTHSGNGVTSSLCLPAGVCTSLTAASLCLENVPANL